MQLPVNLLHRETRNGTLLTAIAKAILSVCQTNKPIGDRTECSVCYVGGAYGQVRVSFMSCEILGNNCPVDFAHTVDNLSALETSQSWISELKRVWLKFFLKNFEKNLVQKCLG